MQAEGAATFANQERLYNSSTVVEWSKAQVRGEKKLVDLFERRILPEFRPAFEAWKKTDPLNNPHAPAGPFFMPEYRSSMTEQATRLNQQATDTFDNGNIARQHSDDYVRVTSCSQRYFCSRPLVSVFNTHAVRVGLSVLATLLLCFPIYRILTLPRA